jgi:hypothetical protein
MAPADFEGEPKLSWKLGKKDIRDIEEQWEKIVKESKEPIATLNKCGFQPLAAAK